jgi:hypothetical protein
MRKQLLNVAKQFDNNTRLWLSFKAIFGTDKEVCGLLYEADSKLGGM